MKFNLSKKTEAVFAVFVYILLILSFGTDHKDVIIHRFLLTLLLVVFLWVRESVNLAVTSLLPIILFPLLGILDYKSVSQQYSYHIIFLFLGGFFMAKGMERWGVHKRIAVMIIKSIGDNSTRTLLGIMIATAFLSMWISNTATVLLIISVANGFFENLKESSETIKIKKLFYVSIAYSASIGGIMTIMGSPPNAVMVGQMAELSGLEIKFFEWTAFTAPIAVSLLLLLYLLMRYKLKKMSVNFNLDKKLTKTDPICYEEIIILLIFSVVFILWLLRSLKGFVFLENIADSTIAIIGAGLMFIIPSKKSNEKLLEWSEAVKIPWGIIFLFGAGFAIAAAFKELKVTEYLLNLTQLKTELDYALFLLSVITFTVFLTEFTSNTASASILIPFIAATAKYFGFNAYDPVWALTISSSCAFMLPIATPPNAIIFSTGYIKVKDLIKYGFAMNIISVIIIFMYFYFIQ